jgi:hypothetical protein
VLDEHRVEPEHATDPRAAAPGDDVGADAAELPLAQVGVALVQGGRDREPEDAVAEELEPLVGRLAIGRGRRVREGLAGPLGVELLDQLAKRSRTLRVASSRVTGAT